MNPEHAALDATAPAPSSAYFKAGTIERLLADRGDVDGRRLPATSKLIAAYLILKAQKQRGYTCILPEREACADLGIDGKTFRKYLAPLTEAQLVAVDKHRPDATRRYHLSALFRRYGEDQQGGTNVVRFGKESRSERSGKVSPTSDEIAVRETAPAVREKRPAGSGNAGAADRETLLIPDPSSILDLPLHDLQTWFGKTHGFPATSPEDARLILAFCAAHAVTDRRQRALVRRFGVAGVAGACAYVVEQSSLAAIANPAGLFVHAAERGKCGDVDAALRHLACRFGKRSRTDAERTNAVEPASCEDARSGKDSRTTSAETPPARADQTDRIIGDLWQSVLDHVKTRTSAAVYAMLIAPARPVSYDRGVLTLEVKSAWLRNRLTEQCLQPLSDALNTLIGPSVTVSIVSPESD